MALTDTKIRSTKPGDKPIKIYDERGLFILINPNGSRWWRFKYRFGEKEKSLSLGVYPEVSLKEAREQRDQMRKQLSSDIDPANHRKIHKATSIEKSANSFEVVAREWFTKYSPNWVPSHADKIIRRLERDIFPWIGANPISEIKASQLLAALRRIEERGALETAHRAQQNCGQVFRYAIATGRAERDITNDLRGALPPVKTEHYGSVTDPKAVGELLRAIEGYKGSFIVKCALHFQSLVFVRPGELRGAEWVEVDLEKAEWRIRAERMKMREQLIVPLSIQAIEVLKELQPLTGNGKYVFPGARSIRQPMSENAITAALRRMGYKGDEMTGHGFRSMASTLLNEKGWNPDAIERQLAHADRNSVRAAYNFAELLPERRKMMQYWANYLDELRTGAKIFPLKTAL